MNRSYIGLHRSEDAPDRWHFTPDTVRRSWFRRGRHHKCYASITVADLQAVIARESSFWQVQPDGSIMWRGKVTFPSGVPTGTITCTGGEGLANIPAVIA